MADTGIRLEIAASTPQEADALRAGIEAFLSEWASGSEYIGAHTSGSTGAPKAVCLAKSDMVVSATATCRYFGIGPQSLLAMPLSADYIAGKMMVVRALVSGARLVVMPPSRHLAELSLVTGPVDLLPIVPAQWPGLRGQLGRVTVRNVIIGGAPLSRAQEAEIAAMDAATRCYATYGMTETCSHVALRALTGEGASECFEAMEGITFASDGDGCLVIDAPAYTGRRFATTDVVRLVDQRHFVWLGRRDHVINSGGIKIMPADAEERLRAFMPDTDFYITSRQSEAWGQEMVMVVANHGAEACLDEALRAAAAALPHHMLPKAVIQVREHEYTSSGKLIRRKF